jgi:hypothetical protein
MICVCCQKTIEVIDHYYDNCIYCHNYYKVDKHKECCLGLEPSNLELERQLIFEKGILNILNSI